MALPACLWEAYHSCQTCTLAFHWDSSSWTLGQTHEQIRLDLHECEKVKAPVEEYYVCLSKHMYRMCWNDKKQTQTISHVHEHAHNTHTHTHTHTERERERERFDDHVHIFLTHKMCIATTYAAFLIYSMRGREWRHTTQHNTTHQLQFCAKSDNVNNIIRWLTPCPHSLMTKLYLQQKNLANTITYSGMHCYILATNKSPASSNVHLKDRIILIQVCLIHILFLINLLVILDKMYE